MGNPLLEPFEGVTLEQWADVNAAVVSGTPLEEAIKTIGVDMPRWDRANSEWLTRMRNDTTFTISKIYGAAFNKSSSGNLGSGSQVSSDSYPFEKWVEAMVAQDVLGKQGRDAQDILKDFGLTVSDYSNVSAYWNGKMMTDFNIAMRMQELLMQYKQKYESMSGGSDSNADITF
ncbi:MAG: hypothetical protein LWX07_06145 [Bacteroidetes bacterium]|nr:hypothetical protein [Bacteroidota bacterium]